MTTNNNTTNNTIYALANMVYNGKGFCVVQKHDGNGGWFHEIEPMGYKCKNFEYIEWQGTPMQFAKDNPTFSTHLEPFHGKPLTFEYTAMEFLKMELEN